MNKRSIFNAPLGFAALLVKKSSLFFLMVFLLSSCNLFIEEEEELLNDGTVAVPIHTGTGYDEAITEDIDGCEVTYQFNRDVRIITEEDLDRHIRSVITVLDGSLIVIDYSTDTPRDRLPVPGEILLCAVVGEKFPYGCNHRVVKRFYENGLYRYVCSFAKLDETYAILNLNGNLRSKPEYFEVDDEEDYTDQTSTRADSKPRPDGPFTVDYGFGYHKSFSVDRSFDFDHGISVGVKMEKEHNYFETSVQFIFDCFNLDNKVFKIEQVFELKTKIELSGSIGHGVVQHLDKKVQNIFSKSIVKGKVIPLGYVVLVFFVDTKLDLEVALSATFSISKHKKSVTTYAIDLDKMAVTKEVKKEIDEPWDFKVESIDGSIGLGFSAILGLGLYGKILSIRLVPKIWTGIKATAPLPKTVGEEYAFDLEKSPNVDFVTEFSISVAAVLDLTLKALLGEDAAKIAETAKEVEDMLEKTEIIAKTYGYDGLETKEKQVAADKLRDDDDSQIGVSHTFGPWEIDLLSTHNTWFPKIKDNTFRIAKYVENKKMIFYGDFYLQQKGFLAGTLGKKFVPALLITLGDKRVDLIYPTEGGENATLTLTRDYIFNIEAKDDDLTYTAWPCYCSGDDIVAVDKPLPFCPTSPMTTITDVKIHPVTCEDTFLDEFNTNDNPDERYWYCFKIDVTAAVKGTSYMMEWGIQDDLNYPDKDNPLKRARITSDKMNKKGDGTYVSHWTYWKITGEARDHQVGIQTEYWPYCQLKKESTGEYIIGTSWPMLTIFANGTYYKYPSKKPYYFAPLATKPENGNVLFDWEPTLNGKWTKGNGLNSSGRTIVRLESIEKDGKTIWQNPDCPPDDWSEDEETPFVLHHF